MIHAADIQDRDGGVLIMATLFGMYPFLRKLYANGGHGNGWRKREQLDDHNPNLEKTLR